MTNRVGTPFAHISSISNPGTSEITDFPACQFWFESYRTVEREAQAGVLMLTQEILFGSNILSSRSVEADARRECYGLQEELEACIIGAMPTITNNISVIFPIYDVDSAFVNMESEGLFILATMYSLKWVITKGAIDA